jgi:hypothetical protein
MNWHDIERAFEIKIAIERYFERYSSAANAQTPRPSLDPNVGWFVSICIEVESNFHTHTLPSTEVM